MIAAVTKNLNSTEKVKTFVSLNLCNSVNVCIDGSEEDIQTLLDKYEEKGI